MLVELLRPATPELARRWLAALLLVPESERASLVASVEDRIVETYLSGPGPSKEAPPVSEGEVVVVYPPVSREGYSEQIERVYTVRPAAEVSPAVQAKTARKRSAGGR